MITILDGYVDEPTCLGVPPYISPYPRYIAGSILDAGENVHYLTIDQLRINDEKVKLLYRSDVIVVIAGMAVPGRYLSGFPASPKELSFLNGLEKPIKILCGPAARHGFGISGGKKAFNSRELEKSFDLIIKGDPEIIINQLILKRFNVDAVDPNASRDSAKEIRDFAIKGANIVKEHPNFPDYLIAEVETYRGCPRAITGGCSFCIEPLKGIPDFRPIKDIIDEIKALYNTGIKHFRIGNQPCIFSYMSEGVGELEFPKPNPEAIEKLFSGIRNVAPDLKTLHIDNANPGTIARYPEECKKIAKIIVRYHTSGDVAAFGVESADPEVIKKNNLKADPDDVIKAVRILNEVGRTRGDNGLPELLPGLNFVFGLNGESRRTFEYNYELLKRLMEENLLVRRINLRQVIPFPGTRIYDIGDKLVRKHKEYFKRFKRLVRETIDRPMLEKIVPRGTLLKYVYTEIHKGKTTFARQLGSYPLLVGIPGELELGRFIDVKVIDYGFRSITALPYPFPINSLPRETIEALPRIGKKRAIRILKNRPFKKEKEFLASMDDASVGREIMEFGIVFDK